MAMGEGGPELVKQLLNKTYDIKMPGIVGIYLDGEPMKGVGPQDVALAIIGATFGNGYVNNKVMEKMYADADGDALCTCACRAKAIQCSNSRLY